MIPAAYLSCTCAGLDDWKRGECRERNGWCWQAAIQAGFGPVRSDLASESSCPVASCPAKMAEAQVGGGKVPSISQDVGFAVASELAWLQGLE